MMSTRQELDKAIDDFWAPYRPKPGPFVPIPGPFTPPRSAVGLGAVALMVLLYVLWLIFGDV